MSVLVYLRHGRSGDIAVLMQGPSHRLLSDRDAPVTRFSELLEHCVPGQFPEIGIEGGGARASMLCGFFNFDRATTHPLLRALPDEQRSRNPDDWGHRAAHNGELPRL